MERPELAERAVEETLRFDSSVVAWRRKTLREVRIAGVKVPAGAQVLMLLGAANRDPEVFEDPEAFHLHRENAGDHLSFGHGIHFCLGSALARLEARVVLRVLAARLPDLRLRQPQQLQFVPNIAFRAPTSLQVVWTPR
ncbi:cytochrome P450 [Marmoricola bigeumensis]|uniref:Cytochrome P450 n=1 Tax=Nocardioides marmoribigeumensis TaxID=433649 RepID=A0ABU2BUX6_9ACTN|nr:cytochrome P450 [Nocardioides marmoribigeumensis]